MRASMYFAVISISLAALFCPSVTLICSPRFTTRRHHNTIWKLGVLTESAQSSIQPFQEHPLDWNLYNLQQQYQKSGGILYKQSLLSPVEYKAIMQELSTLDLSIEDEKESSFATKRMGCTIGTDTEMYRILSDENGSLCRLVNALEVECEKPVVLANDIPIELRIYERAGAGMEWHIDDILYNPSQIEVVLTLENNSDCYTMWKPLNGDIQSVQTTPNSALILKSGGVEHKVSPLKVGRRVILKLAFVRKGAAVLDDMVGHASHHNGKSKNKKRKR